MLENIFARFKGIKEKTAKDVITFKESKKEKEKPMAIKLMAYHCKHCSFTWNASEDNIQKLFLHEKTHLKNNQVTVMEKIG